MAPVTPPPTEPSADVLTRAAALPDAVLRYADHEDGVIDVHLPADASSRRAPYPLLMLVHGGFWKQAYDRKHVRPMARAVADTGWVVAVPEYRRVGGAGGWPATGDDVLAACRALPSLVAGLGVDTHRVVLAGHSAGGHLALWLAGRGVPVDRVVGLAPVADLEAAARDGLGGGAVRALLAGSPDQAPEAYAAADPLRVLDGATPPGEGVVVVHGADDDVVPLSQGRALAARYPHVDLRVLDAGHYDVIDPTSAAWPHVLRALTDLADR